MPPSTTPWRRTGRTIRSRLDGRVGDSGCRYPFEGFNDLKHALSDLRQVAKRHAHLGVAERDRRVKPCDLHRFDIWIVPTPTHEHCSRLAEHPPVKPDRGLQARDRRYPDLSCL